MRDFSISVELEASTVTLGRTELVVSLTTPVMLLCPDNDSGTSRRAVRPGKKRMANLALFMWLLTPVRFLKAGPP
jgi:hypothetical protein